MTSNMPSHNPINRSSNSSRYHFSAPQRAFRESQTVPYFPSPARHPHGPPPSLRRPLPIPQVVPRCSLDYRPNHGSVPFLAEKTSLPQDWHMSPSIGPSVEERFARTVSRTS